jgi:hypothetical protein
MPVQQDKIQQALYDFDATIAKKPNLTDKDLLIKFPEFGNDIKKIQAARDYSATMNSGKYKDASEFNSKFPEFFSVEKKNLGGTISPTGLQSPLPEDKSIITKVPKETSPYLKGLDFNTVTDAIKADKTEKDKNNSSIGALYNFAIGSLSKLGTGALSRMAQSVPSSMGSVGGGPSGTNAISTDERTQAAHALGSAAGEFIDKARSKSSSKENEAEKEFDISKGFGHNIAALGYQLPALAVDLTAGALTSGGSFFAQGEGSAIQELKDNPKASELTPGQAAGYVMTQGFVNGMLMKLGFDKIFKSTGISDLVGKKIASEVTSELIDKGTKATAKDIQDAVLRKATQFMNKAKNVGIKTATGAATGGVISATQSASNDAIKLLVDKSAGKDVFNDKDIEEHFGRNLLNSFAQGSATGGFLGLAHGTLENTNKAIRSKIAEAQSPEDIANIKQNINEEVEKGNITPQEAEAANIKIQDYAQIAAKIPEEISSDRKYAIIGGIEQREGLKNKINEAKTELDNADESFKEQQSANIDLLKGKLEQTHDYINSLITGEEPKYIEENGSYYREDGEGNRTAITKEHFDAGKLVEDNKKVVEPTEVKEPTQEQLTKDYKERNLVTFTYGSEAEVPDVFKDKISSRGENTLKNGEKENFVRVTIPKSLADYELSKLEKGTEKPIATETSVTEEVKPTAEKTETKIVEVTPIVEEVKPEINGEDVVKQWIAGIHDTLFTDEERKAFNTVPMKRQTELRIEFHKNIENTAKELDAIEKEKKDAYYNILKGNELKNAQELSEVYHRSKEKGSNPELVKAVEDLLGKEKPKVEEPVLKEVKPTIAKEEVKPTEVKDGFDYVRNKFMKDGSGGKRLSDKESNILNKEVDKLIERAEKENGVKRNELKQSTWKTNDGYTINEFFENGRGGTRVITPKGEEINLFDNKYKGESGKDISYFPKAHEEVKPTEVEVKQQIENFGVNKKDVEPIHSVISQVFNGLKKAGLTAAKTVGDWVGIGKGEEKPYSLKVDGKDTKVKNVQPEVINGFYSPLEKIVTDSRFDKLPAKQWIEKYANSEEAKWTGLKDWLAQQEGSVSKADIQQYLKDNRISVVEVVMEEKSKPKQLKRFDEIISILNSRGYDIEVEDYASSEMSIRGVDDGTTFLEDRNGGFTNEELIRDGYTLKETHNEDVKLLEEATKEAAKIRNLQQKEDNLQGGTKFSEYQLEGQKEGYKEVLVTMPSKSKLTLEKFLKDLDISNEEYNFRKRSYDLAYEHEVNKQSEKFKSSHFDEPNILVHLRMNTRTDSKGNKVLFLEEVQSDWGQKGKKEGFYDNAKVAELDSKISKLKELEEAARLKKADAFAKIKETNPNTSIHTEINNGNKEIEKLWSAEDAIFKERLEVQKERDALMGKRMIGGDTNVSTAPFVTDTNAWTKLGLKVALKEAVAQGADKIAWTTGEQQNDRYDLSKQVDAIDVSKDDTGMYKILAKKNGGTTASKFAKTPQEIEAFIGKDMADKIVSANIPNGGAKVFSGVDLKVGGKGMKGFYGSPTEGSLGIVGNVAKSLFKQEPKTVEIKTLKPIPPNTSVADIYEAGGMEEFKKKNGTSSTQYSIDITPELKASVEGGQPLFKDAEAQYRIESGKNIVEAIKDFNGSPRATIALTHEIMHPTVVAIIDGAKESNEVGLKHAETIVSEFNKVTGQKVTIEDLIKGNDAFKEGTTSKQYRAVQEFIARSWEKYHKEGGKGFSAEFQKVLNQITEAFQSVYKSLTGKQLTPELRKMFDDILGKEQLKSKENAIQEPSASSVLQHPQEGARETGGERGRVEPSKQGKRIAEKGKQVKVNEKEIKIADAERAEAKKLHGLVKNMDVPTDADSIALRYLAEGGKVSQDAINEIAGTVKRARLNTGARELKTSEAKARTYAGGDETLDGLAHRLWENNGQEIPIEDIKQSLMDAINSHNTRLEASKSYLEKYSPEYKEQQYWDRIGEERETEFQAKQADLENELRNPLDEQIEGEASEEHINNLIKQYEAEFKAENQQPAPEGEGKVTEKVSGREGGEPVEEKGLAKDYQEIESIKSEKVKEKAKEKLINDNFNNIVDQLISNNKIKRVC